LNLKVQWLKINKSVNRVFKNQNLKVFLLKHGVYDSKFNIQYINVIKKVMKTTTVKIQSSINKSLGRITLETPEQYHKHVFVVVTTYVCKLLLQRISSHTGTIKIIKIIR